jgi:uncharacterized membrane protein YdcZ (DUF606 family)
MNVVFAFAQGKFSSADALQNTRLHQGINTPIYSSPLDVHFGLFIKGSNVLRFKNSFAFEMDFYFIGI